MSTVIIPGQYRIDVSRDRLLAGLCTMIRKTASSAVIDAILTDNKEAIDKMGKERAKLDETVKLQRNKIAA